LADGAVLQLKAEALPAAAVLALEALMGVGKYTHQLILQ